MRQFSFFVILGQCHNINIYAANQQHTKLNQKATREMERTTNQNPIQSNSIQGLTLSKKKRGRWSMKKVDWCIREKEGGKSKNFIRNLFGASDIFMAIVFNFLLV